MATTRHINFGDAIDPQDAVPLHQVQSIAATGDAAVLASVRTPKPGEFWIACVDQDGITLSGSDTTGAIGIASPGQQTRVVTVTGADSAVASTKALHFTNGGFTANDQYGEVVIGNATNTGTWRIKTVSSATDLIVEGPGLVNETFSGSVTLTVIGGPKATRDAALTAAKLTPFKTLDRLGAVLPRFGNAASLVVLARARSGGAAYTLADLTGPGDMTWSRNLSGWAMVFFRPTDNFVNDLDDKIRSGYQILPGTNAGGYVATSGATVSNIPCQLVGGGAASIPAEVFTAGSGGVGGVIGYRLRFLSTTPTVALRNYAIMIHRSTTSSVVPAKDLPAVPLPNTDPSGGDKFVIEQTAFWVFDGTLDLGINRRAVFIGVGSTGTVGQISVECSTPSLLTSFMGWELQPAVHFGFSTTNNKSVSVSEIASDEMGGYLPSQGGLVTAIQIGVGYRARLDNFNQNGLTVRSSCDISDTPRTWSGNTGNQKIGPGCVFKSGVTWITSDTGLNTWGESSSEAVDTISIELGSQVSSFGSDGLTGYRRTRITAPFVSYCVGVVGGALRVRGIEVDAASAAVISIGGIGTKVVIDDIIGTGGTIVGPIVDTSTLTVTTPAYGCFALIGTRVAVTASSTVGDIKLVDGTIVPFSALASGFVEDSNGNRFVGAGGIVHAANSAPARVGTSSGALSDVPLTPSTVLGRDVAGNVAAISFSTIVTGGGGGGGIPVTGHAAESVLGNPTGSTGSAVDVASSASTIFARLAAGHIGWQTTAAIKTLLAISATSDISGLAAIATSGSANDLIAGTLPAGRFPALTGDVTTLAGALATTIAHIPFTPLQTALAASTGALSFNNQQLTNVADPTTPQGVATKNYVDTLAAGLKWKKSVRAISTTAGTLATDFAVGQVVDGVTLVLGDRIALAAQVTGADNGLYTVNASGAPTRSTDADTGAELVAATFVSEAGTLNHDKAWVCTNDTITLGTTAVTIVNFQVIVGALLAINNLSDLTNVVTARTNLGLAAIAASGSASDLVTGTIPQAATAAETGDVTKPAGSSATTLANLPQAVLLTRTGALTAPLPMNAQKITGVADPSNPQDAATKAYVDSAIAGLKWKQSVVCASTTNVVLSTGAQNGSVIDDITLTTGTRFALRAQTTQSENGIYTTNASGAPTRATDADTGTELVSCAFFVQQGTINADKAFVCPQDAITLGTTAITFVPFASVVGALIAVNNLSDLTNVATARTNLGLAAIASSGSATDLIAGTVPAARMPAHTGDVTSVAGSVALTLANIPNNVPMAGDIIATAIADPPVPGAGTAAVYLRSTGKVWASRDENGNVSHTVRTKAAASHQFLTTIGDDGAVSAAQPSYDDLAPGTAQPWATFQFVWDQLSSTFATGQDRWLSSYVPSDGGTVDRRFAFYGAGKSSTVQSLQVCLNASQTVGTGTGLVTFTLQVNGADTGLSFIVNLARAPGSSTPVVFGASTGLTIPDGSMVGIRMSESVVGGTVSSAAYITYITLILR